MGHRSFGEVARPCCLSQDHQFVAAPLSLLTILVNGRTSVAIARTDCWNRRLGFHCHPSCLGGVWNLRHLPLQEDLDVSACYHFVEATVAIVVAFSCSYFGFEWTAIMEVKNSAVFYNREPHWCCQLGMDLHQVYHHPCRCLQDPP